jgi:hypothetical protein
MAVIFAFYRNFFWACSGVSLSSCFFVYHSATYLFIVKTFWLKFFTTVVIGVYFHLFHSDQFYFFNNLGYSRAKLYISAALIDLISWLLLAIFTLQFV